MQAAGRMLTAGAGARLLALGLLVMGGCSKKITIIHYPEFYGDHLKTIAVLPLAGKALRPQAGPFVTDRLIDALVENGTYRILAGPGLVRKLEQAGVKIPEPSEGAPADALSRLLGALGERGRTYRRLPRTRPSSAPATSPAPAAAGQSPVGLILAALRKAGGVDAVLIGEVTDFSAAGYSQETVWHYEPPYRRHHGHGYYWYNGGWGGHYALTYPHVTYLAYSHGRVAARVDLVSVANGRTLQRAATARSVISRGDPPALTPDSCLTRAAEAVAEGIVHELAPSPREIQIKPGDVLRTGRGRRKGKWKHVGEFDRDARSVFVIVRLPRACDRNTFRVTITRKDDSPLVPGAILADRTFTWSRRRQAISLEFPLADLMGKSGPGRFRVNFHNAGRVVFNRRFKIRG